MNRLPDLSDLEFSTLSNCLRTAADKFTENAKQFRALKPKLEAQEADGKLTPLIHSSACEPLADQFDQQAKDALKLVEKLDDAVYGE